MIVELEQFPPIPSQRKEREEIVAVVERQQQLELELVVVVVDGVPLRLRIVVVYHSSMCSSSELAEGNSVSARDETSQVESKVETMERGVRGKVVV